MLVHRRMANRRRIQQGLSRYTCGPVVPEGISNYVFDHMEPTTTDFELEYAVNDPESPIQPQGRVQDVEELVPPMSTLQTEEYHMIHEASPLGSRNEVAVEQMTEPALNISEPAIRSSHDTESIEADNNPSSIVSYSSQSSRSVPVLPAGARRQHSVVLWLYDHEAWIDFNDTLRIPKAGMDAVLKIVGAPLQTWRSVVDNLMFHSGMKEIVQTY